MIPEFERAKRVHALDRTATVIGPAKDLMATLPVRKKALISASNLVKIT
jgi:hypothetical protein